MGGWCIDDLPLLVVIFETSETSLRVVLAKDTPRRVFLCPLAALELHMQAFVVVEALVAVAAFVVLELGLFLALVLALVLVAAVSDEPALFLAFFWRVDS